LMVKVEQPGHSPKARVAMPTAAKAVALMTTSRGG